MNKDNCLYNKISIYAVDIGSIKHKNFGWARVCGNSELIGVDIDELVNMICEDINCGKKVALGFECPLFINIPNNPIELTKSRSGEGSRSWSASAGACAMGTGLSEIVWVFTKIKQHCRQVQPTYNFDDMFKSANLFLWEAFVSAGGKSQQKAHEYDALLVSKAFEEKMQNNMLVYDMNIQM